MTVLGCDKIRFQRKIRQKILLLAAASVAVIALNVLLTVFRTDATHFAFAAVNIISDVALIWGGYALIVLAILPQQKLLQLYGRGERCGVLQTGAIKNISDKSLNVQGFPCFQIVLQTDKGDREIYLVGGRETLETGKVYEIVTVENIICRAEERV